jgi:hypothetical protein
MDRSFYRFIAWLCLIARLYRLALSPGFIAWLYRLPMPRAIVRHWLWRSHNSREGSSNSSSGFAGFPSATNRRYYRSPDEAGQAPVIIRGKPGAHHAASS